ncbi:MAG: endonuclease/exonuclease/phosphatase family protein [Candidatus Paceibacterota bacterium]|jgi:endonuclease/exonuclease/phosphatase family metal-dependent hydrolase
MENIKNKDLKIISLNVWGGQVDGILDFFKNNSDVDIFCLQEVYDGGYEYEKDFFEDSKYKNFNLLNDIKNQLPDFNFYFKPHLIDHYGLAIFVKKDIEILKEGEYFVHKEKGYVSEDHIGQHAKNIQYITFKSKENIFNICNFHGIWTGTGKGDTEDRIKQSENIVNFLKTLEGEIVLCGDFNLNPDTESVKIIEDFGLKNLIKENNISTTRTSLYPRRENSPFADYTFVSNNVEVKSFEIMSDEVSDHAAMKLIIKI